MATVPNAERRYRSKVEVLRDLLEAARQDRRKTRIIGRANLNEESFARYAFLALAEGLLERVDHGFRATPLGEEWVGAADVVLTKRAELFDAVEALARVTRNGGSARSGGLAVRPSSWSLGLRPRLATVELTLEDTSLSAGRLWSVRRNGFLHSGEATAADSLGESPEGEVLVASAPSRGRRR